MHPVFIPGLYSCVPDSWLTIVRKFSVDTIKVLDLVDIGKGPEMRVKQPQVFDRDEDRGDAPDHFTERKGIMAFEIGEQGGSPVHCVQRLEHLLVPARDGGVRVTDAIEEVRDDRRVDAGHVARRYKDQLAFCREGPGVQSADRSDTRPDIGYAPDPLNPVEAPALLRAPGDEDNLVDDLFKRTDEAVDECPALVGEEIFFLPVSPPGFSPDKDDCRPHLSPPSLAG
jgi:hypothetical protein